MATAELERFGFAATQTETTQLNKDLGMMSGVSLISVGPAIGHDTYIDDKSLETVLEAIGGDPLPAYITHRGALFEDRLGREIGLFTNFRLEDDRVLADFQAFESFMEDDNRRFNRLFELAEKMPKRFGLSIVFSATRAWATDDGDMPFEYGDDIPDEANFQYPSIRAVDVSSADFVDQPAANQKGLFSKIDNKPEIKMTKIELQEKFDEEVSAKEELSTELETVKTELAAKDSEIESLKAKEAELETVSGELATVKESVEALTAERDELAESKTTLETEKESLSGKITELEAEKTRLNEIIKGVDPLLLEANSDDKSGEDYRPSREARDKIIAEYAKEHGIEQSMAVIRLSRERPELWKL